MFDSMTRDGAPSAVLRRLACFTALMAGLSLLPRAFAQDSAQRVFNSPAAAASALVDAAKGRDIKSLGSILGPDANQVLSSGDPVADNNERDRFVSAYQVMHRLAYDENSRVILYVGAENWPLPIPLVKKDGGWVLDTASGKDELLYRRIGANELYTIGILEDLVTAQQEYAAQSDGEQFARKVFSDPGTHDGLYWPAADGEPESPIGPLIADAAAQGYRTGTAANPTPFHGYYYRLLTRQGKHAPGGAKNYIVGGKMTKGFAFVAYPSEYRASGVMTFIVNQAGVVMQKDLGSDTAKIAGAMKEYNPDGTWSKADSSASNLESRTHGDFVEANPRRRKTSPGTGSAQQAS